MAASYRDIFKATTLFGGIHGLNLALSLIRAKLAAMLLGPMGVGLNSIYNETRELIHTSTSIGLDKSGVKEIATAYGKRNEPGGGERLEETVMLTRSWVVVFMIMGTLFTLLLAPILSWATFNDLNHTKWYILLSPAIGLSTLVCGEIIVLTGLHRIKELAMVSVMLVIVGIVSTIPLYYFFGIDGVVPALVLLFLAQALMVISFSYRLCQPRFRFSPAFMKTGKAMLKLGLSFVLSGVVVHFTQLAIQSYLNRTGSLDTVGYYTSARTITITYTGIVLASIDNDYFPRLTSIFSNYEERLKTVRSQIDVCVPLCLPLSVVVLVLMPILVPLLLSSKFVMMIPMAQIIITSLVYRGMHQPLAYMTLSAGDSKLFFIIESASCVLMLPMVMAGYRLYGLMGIGIALFLSNFIDLFFVALCTKCRYNVLPSREQCLQLAFYSAIVAIAYCTTRLTGMSYWICGAGIIIISCAVTYRRLNFLLKRGN